MIFFLRGEGIFNFFKFYYYFVNICFCLNISFLNNILISFALMLLSFEYFVSPDHQNLGFSFLTSYVQEMTTKNDAPC